MTDLTDAITTIAATPCLLVALDFDGVLAPIVEVPSQARPLPRAADAVRPADQFLGSVDRRLLYATVVVAVIGVAAKKAIVEKLEKLASNSLG